jgi:hypothetical protein
MNLAKKHFIYAIECLNNKYYIGKTTRNPSIRFNEHINDVNCTCVWTNIHKPIKIIETTVSCSNFLEDIITKKYMMRHGIDNVRGGSYSNINLLSWQIIALEKEFLTIENKCYICHSTKHLSPNCPDKKRKFEQIETEISKHDVVLTSDTNNIIAKLKFFFELIHLPINANSVLDTENDELDNNKNIIIIMLDEILKYINKNNSFNNCLIFGDKDKSFYIQKYNLKIIIIQFVLVYDNLTENN